MPKREHFKIDEVSRQSGLTKRTIRFYEDLGLIPAPERTLGGTRNYRREHIELLGRITRLKDVLGVSLEELQKFVRLEETLDTYRQGYRQSASDKKRIATLLEILGVIDEQLGLIDAKIKKIRQAKSEFESMKKRAQGALEKLKQNGEG